MSNVRQALLRGLCNLCNVRCTRISRLRLWKPSNFDFDLRWPLTAPIRVHSFAADDDDDAAADSISGIRPRRCTRTNGPERSKIVKNTSFMQSIHADRTRISENRRASLEGVRSFETPFKGRMDALFPRLASFESCGQGCCINT